MVTAGTHLPSLQPGLEWCSRSPGSHAAPPGTAGKSESAGDPRAWRAAPATMAHWGRPALPKGEGLSPGSLEPGRPSPTLPSPPQKLTIKSGKKSKLFIYTLVCTLVPEGACSFRLGAGWRWRAWDPGKQPWASPHSPHPGAWRLLGQKTQLKPHRESKPSNQPLDVRPHTQLIPRGPQETEPGAGRAGRGGQRERGLAAVPTPSGI